MLAHHHRTMRHVQFNSVLLLFSYVYTSEVSLELHAHIQYTQVLCVLLEVILNATVDVLSAVLNLKHT